LMHRGELLRPVGAARANVLALLATRTFHRSAVLNHRCICVWAWPLLPNPSDYPHDLPFSTAGTVLCILQPRPRVLLFNTCMLCSPSHCPLHTLCPQILTQSSAPEQSQVVRHITGHKQHTAQRSTSSTAVRQRAHPRQVGCIVGVEVADGPKLQHTVHCCWRGQRR
jgi:hypothetical protein